VKQTLRHTKVYCEEEITERAKEYRDNRKEEREAYRKIFHEVHK
jgi:hypothetical protein